MTNDGRSKFGEILRLLHQTRNVSLPEADIHVIGDGNVLAQLKTLNELLQSHDHPREATAVNDVLILCEQPHELGGLDLQPHRQLAGDEEAEILFLVSAWLEALNSADRAKEKPEPLSSRPPGRRGMTLSEKVFAMHDVAQNGFVKVGDLIRVDVDWVIASEASWAGMEATYNSLGQPEIFRNDRFWLAGDHVIDPRVKDVPQVKALVDASERAKKVFKLTEYQGMNYTILHTEFYRERAQPGMLVIGSDSHTCSSGALGCLAIGLGAADVTLPLVTGETWFKVPESVNVRLIGSPKPGIGGKDIILYILQQLKRNTVASERIVEYTGPGLQYLTSDARFAICNMTAELGGITGIFVPDGTTLDFVQKRLHPRHKTASIFLKPDEDAQYAETYEINLGNVHSFIAKHPKPDDVVPVAECENMPVDGCFIGACTTTEEELILGALVLEQGLKSGLKPVNKGNRRVVPGSLPIQRRLRELGLLDIYEACGYKIGVPGCSYCVGMSADQAKPGEVWLSSQNRNFENRMGKGSFAYLASAATVAASSFEMKVKDPHDLLCRVNLARWNSLKAIKKTSGLNGQQNLQVLVNYVEPNGFGNPSSIDQSSLRAEYVAASTEVRVNNPGEPINVKAEENVLKGKIQKLGNYIDTDALAPANFLVESKTNEVLGTHCLEYTHPDFRQKVKDGFNIVVAGTGFGCGSSREQAVMALLGCGVQCVIAKSFAFIFQRNMPNLGLLGITISDESFYDAATDGTEISINLSNNEVVLGKRQVKFELSQMEKELFDHGGISSAFQKFAIAANKQDASTSTTHRISGFSKSEESSDCLQELSAGKELEFKRMNKPEKLEELEREIRELRSSIANTSATGAPLLEGITRDQQATNSQSIPEIRTEHYQPGNQLFSILPILPFEQRSTSIPIDTPSQKYKPARSLNDITLAPDKVTKLFHIFFDKYHPHHPILNPLTTPEEYFSKSALLFWTISYVASRRDVDDPHLLVSLIPSVKKLLWEMISNPPHTLELVQSIVLICMWPFPTSSLTTDSTVSLATLAHSIALQLGLHRPDAISDFSRTHKRLSQNEISDCLKTWSACYIALQSNLFTDGQPSPSSYWTIDRLSNQDDHTLIPEAIVQQLKIYRFVTCTSSSIAGVPRFAEGSARPGDTLPLLALLEQEFHELGASIGHGLTDENSILLDGAGLQLYIFYLMELSGSHLRKMALLRGYSLAIGLIRRASDLAMKSDFIHYGSQVLFQVLSLAAMFILKLSYSGYSRFIEVEEGKRMFHIGAQLIRQTSLEDNDLQGRMSKILTQLWSGYARIGKCDEEPSLKLRTRLAASLLHDLLWSWRNAFGNQGNDKTTSQGIKGPHHLLLRLRK
ncbi:aconitase family protein [Talaromyces stipitatus ATCC 10500]|uniref:Aconitase family protein n=1 Tax=Talaromyces stipitatus (strain ATCC 10500 / CBS 375.48 / QM 6759 / NRRL 1006) TaxID=441959 RepID=B8M422_TALSN|nr:aconitase family protein [Talaromyces stipitatus ATCC 10500]EED20765.1 aconitase family protein [Talaromyces stipitatus ATCC 10500]